MARGWWAVGIGLGLGREWGGHGAIRREPEPADAVVEADGARVFLDSTAQAALDDQVLDAQMNEDGSVRFALAAQA